MLHSEPFAAAFQACVKHCAACAAEQLSQGLHKQKGSAACTAESSADEARWSLAHTVAPIAQAPRQLLAATHVNEDMMALPEVKSFMLDVYARGPFMTLPRSAVD